MSNVPKLRFSEFIGEWEEKELSYLISSLDAGVSVNSMDVIAKEGEKAILKTSCVSNGSFDISENKLVSDDSEIQRLKEPVKANTIIISRMNTPNLVGANAFINSDNDNIYLPDRLWSAKIKDTASAKWISILIASPKIRTLLSSRATGTSNSMKNITKGDVLTLPVTIPSKKEQEKIASFLTSIDTKIEQLTKKEALLQEYKKGVMQKIFNQEIRFKDDDGSEFCEWEEKKLGDILDYIQPTKYLVKDTEYNDRYTIPVLTAGKTFILGYTNETDGVFENNLPVIIFDDFTTANKFVNFPFKAKSSAMKILTPKDNNNIKFIYEAMQMIKYEVGGHERHWISKFSFLNIFIPYIEEQIKIANFLSSIDTKIEQTQKQLESSKEFKKALLQQMFV